MAELLGRAFLRTPENETYPFAGLFVESAVRELGLERVRQHLLPATPAEWPAACGRAGSTPEALEQAFVKLLTQ